MPTIVQFNQQRAVDLNAWAVPGAQAYFYDSGTNNLRRVYADAGCNIPHPSPLLADGAGVFPPVFDVGGGDVKVNITTQTGETLAGYPLDPAAIISTDVTGASAVAFDPTIAIPETNVQDAIERVQENMLQPLADYGLGVTGNATLIADINATNIASGFYRYDGTTAGTFPAGVTKADAGVVLFFRRNGGSGLMQLIPAPADRIYYRRINGAAYAPWQWLLDSNDTVANATWIAGTSNVPAAITPAALRAGAGGLGVGQGWQIPTRLANTTYGNTTGRPIQVIVTIETNGSGTVLCGATAGSMIAIYGSTDWDRVPLSFVVPAGHFYRVNSPSALWGWSELR